MFNTTTNALNAAALQYGEMLLNQLPEYQRSPYLQPEALPTTTPMIPPPSLTPPNITPNTQGTKHDHDKPRLDLIDPEFLEGLGRILGFGAAKYAAHNWRNGIDASRLIAAAYRHLGAINKGEDLDPESGDHHAYHLGCCIMFLAWTLQHKPEHDDRYKGNQA